jgi:RNA polymerase subunit RPABC4/transcription elongation factor Spt4
MGSLTESTFTERVSLGCPACGAKKLSIRAYVAGKFPLMGGEPVGPVTWAYKGEIFVDGVFEIRCAACPNVVFADAICPRCHAPDGLARALGAENRHAVPQKCPTCGIEALAYFALVPATVTYEGKRADKARTSCELYDPGFHGLEANCSSCGPFARRDGVCPLCDAPRPLRASPG